MPLQINKITGRRGSICNNDGFAIVTSNGTLAIVPAAKYSESHLEEVFYRAQLKVEKAALKAAKLFGLAAAPDTSCDNPRVAKIVLRLARREVHI